MRLAVISDIHANLEALQAVASAIEAEQVDRIVCLGDVVGYNADPEACLELLRRLDPIWIAGNHDRAVTGQITTAGFSKTAAHAVAWTRERLAAEHIALLAGLALRARIGDEVVAVHGAWHPAQGCESVRLDTIERRRLSLDALADDPGGARICLFGHTHRPAVAELVAGRMRDLGVEEVSFRADAHHLLNSCPATRTTCQIPPGWVSFGPRPAALAIWSSICGHVARSSVRRPTGTVPLRPRPAGPGCCRASGSFPARCASRPSGSRLTFGERGQEAEPVPAAGLS